MNYFTLVDNFYGIYSSILGNDTFVTIDKNSNVAFRVGGTSDLSTTIVQGDFVQLGGFEYRVCLGSPIDNMYSESALPLCSITNSEIPAVASSAVRRGPIFKMNTSIGTAKRPGYGDTYLKTFTLDGSPSDLTSLSRGDLIRVGHPHRGELFCVSMDKSRVFNSQNLPLASSTDPFVEASLSHSALIHATHEVQDIIIKSSSSSVILTPSTFLVSGFRIKYLSHVTSRTTSGGAPGCIGWDDSPLDIENELLLLTGMDGVKVSSEIIPIVEGTSGAGIIYHITFTGKKNRGDLQLLEVVDVGNNGCLDSADAGGNFGDFVEITVEKSKASFIPIYKMHTTKPIPYNAVSNDIEAALQSLPLTCGVKVTRTIYQNGFIWDMSFLQEQCGVHCHPIPSIVANGQGLQAVYKPDTRVINLRKIVIPVDRTGISYYLRISARNSFGMSQSSLSNPFVIEASIQAPASPTDVRVDIVSNNEVLVQWGSPIFVGDGAVTHYKVDYDESPNFNSGANDGPMGSLYISADDSSEILDVQSISVSVSSSQNILHGTFSLMFGNNITKQLHYDATAEEVETALEEICTIHNVEVTRHLQCSQLTRNCDTSQGYTWLVTFTSTSQPGNQHPKFMSSLDNPVGHKLQIAQSFFEECADESLNGCNPSSAIVANVGSTSEVQEFVVGSIPFTISFGGKTSHIITLSDSLIILKQKIEVINTLGKVHVACFSCDDDIISPGSRITLTMYSLQGDIPLVHVSDSSVTVVETRKGIEQPVVGQLRYKALITELSSLKIYHVRVSAFNKVGSGQAARSWPLQVRPYVTHPMPARDISTVVNDFESLKILWNSPLSDGGNTLTDFIIDLDTSPAFSSQGGYPSFSTIVSASDADNYITQIATSHFNSSNVALRKRVTLVESDPVINGIVTVGSKIYMGLQNFTVVAVNEDSCGISCITLDNTYEENIKIGAKIYLGHAAKQYRYIASNLTPGVSYYTRIRPRSEDLIGPSTYFGYPKRPLSVSPMSTPMNRLKGVLSSSSATNVNVMVALADDEKPEGNYGSPISSYKVDLSSRVNEVQIIKFLIGDHFTAGAFRLVLDTERTRCVPIVNLTSAHIALFLEELINVDGVKVEQNIHKLSFQIEFNGPSFSNGNQPELQFDQSDCEQIEPSSFQTSIETLVEGNSGFVPEVVSIKTLGTSEIYGHFEVSLNFVGVYEQEISANGIHVQVSIEAGSRIVKSNGIDLSLVIIPGETIQIGTELVTIHSVSNNILQLNHYHKLGTSGAWEKMYRMDNFIGHGHIEEGSTILTARNGTFFFGTIGVGDYIKIVNFDFEGFFEIESLHNNTLVLKTSYHGPSLIVSIFKRKAVLIDSDSSAAALKNALESLPGVGMVDVERLGPTNINGYHWMVSFVSAAGMLW